MWWNIGHDGNGYQATILCKPWGVVATSRHCVVKHVWGWNGNWPGWPRQTFSELCASILPSVDSDKTTCMIIPTPIVCIYLRMTGTNSGFPWMTIPRQPIKVQPHTFKQCICRVVRFPATQLLPRTWHCLQVILELEWTLNLHTYIPTRTSRLVLGFKVGQDCGMSGWDQYPELPHPLFGRC